MTAIAYAEGPQRLAERETEVGTVALIAYQGKLTLRIWSALNWRDAKFPAPTLTLDGRAGMWGSKDMQRASSWLDYSLPAIVKAEQ